MKKYTLTVSKAIRKVGRQPGAADQCTRKTVSTKEEVLAVCRFGVFRYVLLQCHRGKDISSDRKEATLANFQTICSQSLYNKKKSSQVENIHSTYQSTGLGEIAKEK